MKNVLTLLALVLSLNACSTVAPVQTTTANNTVTPIGKWAAIIYTPYGNFDGAIQITQAGTALKGNINFMNGKYAFSNIKVDGTTLTLDSAGRDFNGIETTYRFEGKFTAETLDGTLLDKNNEKVALPLSAKKVNE